MAEDTLPHGEPLPGALTAILRELAAAPEAPESEPALVQPGTVIGRFEVVRELGRGAFGVAYEARDRELGRSVALKIVRPGKAKVGEAQLAREAEAVARLSHPNLVTLHDVGRSELGPYLVFELLRGETLQARLDRERLSPSEAVHIAIDVARGLAHAHCEGVFHRDLKPSNVFLSERGVAKILDFGMAHAFGRRRASGGTPAYMAPEQWEDAPEDERTDVFALGVMLHEMLAGELPFPADGRKWASGASEAPRLDVTGAPDLGPLVARMLAKVPTRRPRDGGEVVAALERIAASLPPAPVNATPPRVTRRRSTFGELVAELKRRRVFRVMVGYGVFSFAVLQVTEPIMHGARLGDWVLTAVLVALAIGFPVAVILSWLFDLTSQGVQRAPSPTSSRALSLPRGRLAALLVGVGLLAALPGLGWYAWKRAGRPAVEGSASISAASIAVLPFADLSPNHDQDFFSDGVAEEILNALSRVEGLRVPARTSSFWFKGKNAEPSEVGQKLGVAHLLEGSVRRSGTKLRITAEVTRIAGGDRLWSQTFDRDGGDVLVVQDEIARAVVEALKVKLLTGHELPVREAKAANQEAYGAYLLGKHLFGQFSEGSVRRSVNALERAVALDPGYAPAWAGLSRALYSEAEQEPTADAAAVTMRRALTAAERAVALGPELPDGYVARARLTQLRGWNWEVSLSDARHALALLPGSAEAHSVLGELLHELTQYPEALRELRAGADLDPLSTSGWSDLGWAAINAGRLDLAHEALQRVNELNPDHAYASGNLALLLLVEGRPAEALAEVQRGKGDAAHRLLYLALAHHDLGHEREARAALEELIARFGHTWAWQVAEAYAWLGDADRAFEWTARARTQLDAGVTFAKSSVRLRRLRQDPRYAALLRSLNLPPEDALPGGATATIPAPSIAVLPFDDLSEKHDQGYFADGVAEEILNALAHVDGLKVIGRTSSFSFRGRADDLKEIGARLDVATVLEGTLRRAGDRVRISAQLLRIADGSLLWSESYERRAGDLFKVQDEVAKAVVAALGPKLVHRPVPASRRTSNPEAHDLYLRGLYLWNLRTGEGLQRAAELFRQAVAADPAYAPAHVGLANALSLYPEYTRTEPGPYLEQARAAARRALELDPALGEAHAALGTIQADQLDWQGALAAFETAVRLSPDSPTVRQWHAEQLCNAGLLAPCRAEYDRAYALDPTSRIIGTNRARSAIYARDYPAAERQLRQVLELAPDFNRARFFLAQALALQGRSSEALAEVARMQPDAELEHSRVAIWAMAGRRAEALRYANGLEAQARRGYVPPGLLVDTWAAAGDREKALAALRAVCAARDAGWLDAVTVDPTYDALRTDPRWPAILECLHLR